MDCSDCKAIYEERKQKTPCKSCHINWIIKESEAMGFKIKVICL
jgi:hypothetical protein